MPRNRGTENKKARGRLAPGAGSSVGLANTQKHRARFSMKQKGNRVVIDMLDQLYTAATFGPVGTTTSDGLVDNVHRVPILLSAAPPANIGLPVVLPKLQAMARAFNRYRILRARVHYQSTCSAATNASVGIALVPGVAQTSPTLRDVAGYSAGEVGPAWSNFNSGWWSTGEDRLFFIDNPESDESVPVSIVTVVESLASAKVNTGLFWLEMMVELVDIRPQPATQAVFNVGTPQVLQQSGSTIPVFEDILNMAGDFGWGDSAARRTAQVGDASLPIPSAGSVAVAAADWLWDYYWDCSAATSSGHQTADHRGLTYVDVSEAVEMKAPHRPRTDSYPEGGVRRVRHFPEEWRTVRSRLNCAFRTTSAAIRAAREGFDPVRLVRESPNAAGDFTVYLNFQPSVGDDPAGTVYSKTFSPGTGAVEVAGQVALEVDLPGFFYWFVTPTGVEARTILDSSTVSLQRVNRNIAGTL